MQQFNNVDALQNICRKILAGKSEIQHLQDWRSMLHLLHHYKLIIQDDLHGIPQSLLIFPIKLSHFFGLVTQNFCTKQLRSFMLQLEGLKQQVQDCQTTIDFWAEKGLKSYEIKSLLVIFSRLTAEMQRNVDRFEQTNREVQKIKESILQVKDNLREQLRSIPAVKVRSAFEYQEDQIFAIQKIYYQERVRQVHSRNQPIRVLEVSHNGVISQIGYNIKNDMPIEVIKIPKLTSQIEELQIRLNSFAAYKELFFSTYFPKFLGSNSNSDPQYNLYFMEFKQTRSLAQLADTRKLAPEMALVRYWCLQILLGLKDLLYMTTYLPVLPITLNSLHCSLNGINLYFKGLPFLRQREYIDETHERLQARLLRNFADLIFQLLKIDLEGLESDLNFKFFVEALLGIEEDELDFQQMKVDTKLTLENIFQLDILKSVERDARAIGKEFSELFPD